MSTIMLNVDKLIYVVYYFGQLRIISIDKILELKHELIIPSHIMESELHNNSTLKTIQKFIKQGKIQILEKNPIKEIQEFQKDHLGSGECDSMLSYQKLNNDGNKVYYILDDREARIRASKLDNKIAQDLENSLEQN